MSSLGFSPSSAATSAAAAAAATGNCSARNSAADELLKHAVRRVGRLILKAAGMQLESVLIVPHILADVPSLRAIVAPFSSLILGNV
jgi:hypothetical protein